MDEFSPSQVGTWAAVIASVLTIVLQLVNMINTNYKEERARRWRLEDEARAAELAAKMERDKLELAAKLEHDKLTLALKLEQDKSELARQTRHSIRDQSQHITTRFNEAVELLSEVKRELEKNTEISKEAFKEANDVNGKILRLGLAIPKEVIVANEEPIRVNTQPTGNHYHHSSSDQPARHAGNLPSSEEEPGRDRVQ